MWKMRFQFPLEAVYRQFEIQKRSIESVPGDWTSPGKAMRAERLNFHSLLIEDDSDLEDWWHEPSMWVHMQKPVSGWIL